MKYLVTGCTGHLGQALGHELIRKGHEVWASARRRTPEIVELEKLGQKTHFADVTQIKTLEECFLKASQEGPLDGVFHCAAKVAAFGRWSDFHSTNVDGTRNIIQMCQKFGVKKLVFTSSPSVVFGRDDLCYVDESTPYAAHSLSMYSRSKAMAEAQVLSSNNSTLATIALRPHLILGPLDRHLIPRLVESHRQGRLAIVGTGENQVDIIATENAVLAHIMAMEKLEINHPISGRAYFLGQKEAVKLWPFLDQIMQQYSLGPIKKRIPFWPCYQLGSFFEWRAKLKQNFQDDLPMTRFVALQLAKSHYFNHERFLQEIGDYQVVTTQELLLKLRPKQVSASKELLPKSADKNPLSPRP